MKVSGFTIVRNGVILEYPFVESILVAPDRGRIRRADREIGRRHARSRQRKLLTKSNAMKIHYRGDDAVPGDEFRFDLRMVKRFKGALPKVMEKRIALRSRRVSRHVFSAGGAHLFSHDGCAPGSRFVQGDRRSRD
jgi:hypothetical protein